MSEKKYTLLDLINDLYDIYPFELSCKNGEFKVKDLGIKVIE
jgi:hypothetical protein